MISGKNERLLEVLEKRYPWRISLLGNTIGIFNSSPPGAAYVSVNWVSIGSDNGLSPVRRQAIIWTYTEFLSIGLLATKFSKFLIKIENYSSQKLYFKLSSAKWWPFCLGLNMLIPVEYVPSNYGLKYRTESDHMIYAVSNDTQVSYIKLYYHSGTINRMVC